MDVPKLSAELSQVSYMFITSEMIISKFVHTRNPEQVAAAKVLIEAERERIRQAFTALQNNLSASFYSAMNKINIE